MAERLPDIVLPEAEEDTTDQQMMGNEELRKQVSDMKAKVVASSLFEVAGSL